MYKEILKNQDVENLISHSKVAKWLFDTNMGRFTLRDYEIAVNVNDDPSESFHPNGDVCCIVLDDDYCLGIRCNHLILMDGCLDGGYRPCILIFGNHKGFNALKIIEYELFDGINQWELYEKMQLIWKKENKF